MARHVSLNRRSALRRAGLGLLASLLPKALKAFPHGKAGSGGGGSSPATIRVTVSAPQNKNVGAIFIGDDLTVGVGGTDPTPIFVSDLLSQYTASPPS